MSNYLFVPATDAFANVTLVVLVGTRIDSGTARYRPLFDTSQDGITRPWGASGGNEIIAALMAAGYDMAVFAGTEVAFRSTAMVRTESRGALLRNSLNVVGGGSA